MTRRWIIKNDRDEFLVGFSEDGVPRWRSARLAWSTTAVVYSTEDLGRVAIPALASAEVDVYTIMRHS